MPELSVDDLDLKVARRCFQGRRDLNEQALLTLKLVRSEQGKLVPTQGAMLLFGHDRINYFPDAWVQCGRFIGRDKAVIFDHIELYDPLPQMVESILLFLKKHALRGADFSALQRRDVWSIPLGILREAVINALVHADYSQRGAPIRIAFFDDRIEIENPGILLPGLTIADMKQGISKIRNPVIARVFRELNLIEQWGSGVRRMFNEAAALGLPEPEILEIGMRLRLIVYLADVVMVAPSGVQTEAQVEVQVEGSEAQVKESEAQVDRDILALCAIRPRSSSEIAAALGHKRLSGNVRQALPRLKRAGLLEYTIPEKPHSRLQKYRLTARGKALLE
ncbi:ATP-binding protein [Trichothermofontia sp.]